MNLNFDINSPLCRTNIRACAAASLAAYESPTVTDSATRESVLIQDCPGLHSFSGGGGGAVVIAFPGTHDLPDILRDLQCFREATLILGKPCSVHRGFARSYAALMPYIADLSIIREKPVFITGHSKGAAVAKRCALSLIEKNVTIAAVITFGEPRGGDSRYAKLFNSVLGQGSALRITNAADPVPWLPSWLAGNRHCGPEAWLPPISNPLAPIGGEGQGEGASPRLLYGPRLWWELLCNAREIYQSIQLKNLAPLGDHHIATYLQRLNFSSPPANQC